MALISIACCANATHVIGEVMRKQFRFNRSACGELIVQHLTDTTVQNVASALEQILISRVLNERVLETIFRLRQ
jgi:hypothetical protein